MKEARLLRRIQPAQRGEESDRQFRDRKLSPLSVLMEDLRKDSTVSFPRLRGIFGALAGVPCQCLH